MPSGLAEIMFEAHLEEVRSMPEAVRWKIEKRDGLVLHVTLHPKSAPNEEFLARLSWDEYPGTRPASVIFLDPKTLASGVNTAWPIASGFRPPTDICTNWTKEGFDLHPEWLRTSLDWEGGDIAVLTQLRHLQLELDSSFQGRHR
jgi:hypothetical protein